MKEVTTIWRCVGDPHLFSSQGSLAQDRAYMSFSASEAMVAFLYISHAKSHSFTPPAAIALQYTVDLKLALMLEGLMKMGKVTQGKETAWLQ